MTDETGPIDPGIFPADDAASLTDAELRALHAEAKASGNDALRRLLASYITLRSLAAEVLTLIEAREGSITVVQTPIFSRLKHLTRRAK